MEPITILIAAKPKKTLEEIQAERAKVVAEKKRIQEVKDRQKMNNPTYCENVLNDVRAILDGKGKVNNIDDYKYIEDGVTKYLVGNEPGYDKGYVKSSIDSRVTDLKVDIYDLANKHRKKENPDPKHGSYEGHQHTLDNQKEALTRALGKLTKSCKDYPLTQEQQEVKKRAEQAVKTPTPQEPDPKFRQKSATASESQKLKQIINSIPGMSQAQKDATRKALESTGIPKIIKDSVNGGKEYWEKTGKQQLKTALDTLVNTGKIAAVIAIVILEFVGKLATGQLVSNPQDTTETPSIASTDKTVALNEDSTNYQTINPAPTPVATTSTNTLESKQPISSAPFTSTIPNSQSNSNSKSLVSGKETNIVAENTNQTSANTATNLTTQSSQTNLQATASMGETAAVAQVNNAKLQEILARMQVRAPQTSNNIAVTTSEINQESIATNPNTNRLVTSSDATTPTALTETVPSSTALTENVPTSTGLTGTVSTSTGLTETVPSSTALTGTVPSSTALTGNVPSSTGLTETVPSSTALTGNVPSSTALTGTVPSNTALTGTIAGSESSKPTQLQPEMALS
jgi:hypothetical protein